MYTITPLVVATGPQREKSRFTYMHNFGDKVDIPYVAWLLRGDGPNILVDAGCSAADFAEHVRGGASKGPLKLAGETFADVQDVTPLHDALAGHGLTPDDIEILVQTHLDWDHCMNTRHFARSRILLQEAEWRKVPVHPFFKGTYAPQWVYERIGKMDLTLLEGDHKITEGVELMFTPGHSPGGQSVVVDTSEGRYVIAGMCTIRDNFYPPAEVLESAYYEVIPPGMHVDPLLCYESMLRMLEVGGDKVLPFHDSAVLELGTIGS
jgi:glyoxylase-like metal-dependent hydrolase (beta-lactamase superfamily II)